MKHFYIIIILVIVLFLFSCFNNPYPTNVKLINNFILDNPNPNLFLNKRIIISRIIEILHYTDNIFKQSVNIGITFNNFWTEDMDLKIHWIHRNDKEIYQITHNHSKKIIKEIKNLLTIMKKYKIHTILGPTNSSSFHLIFKDNSELQYFINNKINEEEISGYNKLYFHNKNWYWKK